MTDEQLRADIVIHGGGMAGAVLAKRLSASAAVTLVDPNEYFEVPMAAPRSLVEPSFADRAIIPFRAALPGVRHLRAALVELNGEEGVVAFADGRRETVSGRVTVLATGSAFSNPLMRANRGASVEERRAFYERFGDRLERSRRILIVGGGPIGVEVAGEIVERQPDKRITILEGGPRLLRGTSEAAARHAARFLSDRGVTIVTGDRLEDGQADAGDPFAPAGVARTRQGREIAYDLLIWCTGGRPNTGYMKAHFGGVLNEAGRIRVTPELRVAGQDRLFALGDITDLDENKMAWHINGQVAVAEHNVAAVLAGGAGACGLKAYKAQTGNPTMAVTLGSRNGVVQLPGLGAIRWAPLVRRAKAAHMLVPKYRKVLGV